MLRENDVEPTIVELNLDTVRAIRQQGWTAIYGDATHRDTLQTADVARAAYLVLSAAGIDMAAQIIRLAREINPDIRVLARTEFLPGQASLRLAGAELVCSAEAEVALAMTEFVLRDFGATPEQIDRQREQLRRDLEQQIA